MPLFVRVGSRLQLGDLKHEYDEAMDSAQKKPDLKALDAEVKSGFEKNATTAPTVH